MKSDQRLLFLGYILLVFHNFSFLGRFMFDDWNLGFISTYLGAIQPDYWIYFVLEFLAVATFFADIIIGFDKKKGASKWLGMAFTAIHVLFFFAKIIPWYFGELFLPFTN